MSHGPCPVASDHVLFDFFFNDRYFYLHSFYVQTDAPGVLLRNSLILQQEHNMAQKPEKKQSIAKELYRHIFDKLGEGILIADAVSQQILQGNATICSMLGYSKNEIGDLTLMDILASKNIDHLLNTLGKRITGENIFFEDLPFIKIDGSIFSADVETASLKINGKQYVVCICHDTTGHKYAAETLKTARNFLDELLDNLMDAVIVINAADYSILRANKIFLDFFGLDSETVIDKHCYELNHRLSGPCSFSDGPCPVAETLSTGRQATEEHIHYDRTGVRRYIAVTAIPIAGEGGQIRRIIHLARDITQRRQAEQALRQQREELSQVSRLATVGEFTASLAHEIHQPLTAIMNNAMAALRFLSLPDAFSAIEEVRDALKDIIDDDQRASEVIQHLRSFLKKKEVAPSACDVNTVIQDVLTILRGELIDKNVHVVQTLSPNIPKVHCGRVEMQQILLNLIMNACDALVGVDDQRRQIRIRTSMDGPGRAIVAVEDSGTGLNPNDVIRIFESYYTTKPDGLGMGLSIIKSIVSAHGGRIWAENNAEGGATFFFTLSIHTGDTP